MNDMPPTSILGAFSEEQVSRLTGLSLGQLRGWNRRGFIRPEFRISDNPRKPFSYIYSFKDLLKLRVLNQLRNVHGVQMAELERVERALAHMGDEKWTSQKLWVGNRKVVFEEPESRRKREVASKQFVAEIALEVVTSDARRDIELMNRRNGGQVGHITRKKFVHSSEPVFAGTRIPVTAVTGFLSAGYEPGEIIDRFPSLEVADIDAARHWQAEAA
ncbi:DUF433 domain-containing protein [Novosphingobium lentum]|uniref:DUF433 domain-containing protein n=1 Tax=Novosphingobium lentum TaxID=145287 RepID=UPI001470259C|nr:DUF433 domain-containing protein [Novosphingobium lentum]